MKTLRFFLTFGLVAALTAVAAPARSVSAQGGVTASAVFVPAQVSKLGFVTSGLVREISVKVGDRVKAGDILVVLDSPELQYAVTAAEAALRSAQANAELQRYKRVKDRRNGKVFWDVLPPEVIAIADVQVIQAQAALEIAQAIFAQTTLAAPFDGTIADLNVVPGEFVQSGQAVIALAMLDQLQVETTDLSERDIMKVRVGDSANISVDALNENIQGEVIAISPIADVVGGDVVFKVTIELEEQIDGLLWGMTAEVTIGE